MNRAQQDNQHLVRFHSFGALCTVLLITVLLCAFVSNAWYVFPVEDDYTFSKEIQHMGILSFIEYRYLSWNGRYASDLSFGLIYGLLNILSNGSINSVYVVAPLIVILFIALGFFIFSMLLQRFDTTGQLQHRFRALSITALLLTMLLLIMRTGQSVYAVNGGISYLLGSAMALMLICGLIHTTARILTPTAQSPAKRNTSYIIYCVLYALSTLYVTGFNESLGPMLAVLLFSGVVWAYLHNKRSLPLWGISLVSNIIGIIAVGIAPGNTVRVQRSAEHGIVSKQIFANVADLLEFGQQIIIAIGLTMILVYCAFYIIKSLPWARNILVAIEQIITQRIALCHRWFRFWILCGFPLLIVAGMLVSIVFFTGAGPHRLRDGIYYLAIPYGIVWKCTLLSSRVGTTLTSKFFQHTNIRQRIQIKYAALLFAIALLFFAHMLNNSFTAHRYPKIHAIAARFSPSTPLDIIFDAFGRGYRYRQSTLHAFDAIEVAKLQGMSEVTIYPLCTIAPSLVYQYISTSPSNAVYLHALAQDFGIDSVEVASGSSCH